MLKYRLCSLMLASALGIAACSGDDDQVSSNSAPVNQTFVIFSPGTSELPVPSDLQFSAQVPADGTMSAGVDPSNPVITGIDSLDGNSVLAPFDIEFSGGLNALQNIDASSFVAVNGSIIPNPNQNVFLLPLTYPGGDGLRQATTATGVNVEVPTFAEALTYQAAAATADVATLSALAAPVARAEVLSINGGRNNMLRISPLVPLQAKTKYLVVVTNLEDINGNAVQASSPYRLIRDPASDLTGFGGPETTATLEGLRGAIIGWETLATGYFGFMQSVFDAAGVPATAPTPDDIIFSMTFTTGGTTDILTSIAAPEAFITQSISTGLRQDAILNVVDGSYALSGTPTIDSPSAADLAINATLNLLLTSQTLPDNSPNPLFNPNIAGAIAAGADYATLAMDASAAHIIQRAAAEAAITASNGDGLTIAAEAQGLVDAIVGGASQQAGISLPTSAVFPVPAARPTNFFRVDSASDISPLLAAPARIYQGEITLPYYQQRPTETDLSPVVRGSWQSNQALANAFGANVPVLDANRQPVLGDDGEPLQVAPPITYRYPFPEFQSNVTSPVLVTTPDETVLGAFGVTRPAEGWPVIIFVHGITSERSTSLPMANALAFACIARDAMGNPTGVVPGVPCYATVAIDQPLHGVAAVGSIVPGLASVNDPGVTITANIGDNVPSAMLTERHFDVTAGPDGTTPTLMDYTAGTGSSGSLFVNLTSFTTARDNLRQMAVDLLNLNASLDSMDLNDDGTADELDASNVYFIGHSLGAINGLPFVAINNSSEVQNSANSDQPMVRAAAGLVTGGGITRLLANSQSFAPNVLQGLAAASDALTQGNSGLESYFSVFQGVLDSIDVTNFASSLSDANGSTGILLTEVIGDMTIPNAADSSLGTPPLSTTVPNTGFMIDNFPAPLAGTEPMIAQFGAIPSDAIPMTSDGDAEVLVTRFTAGSHGTPVSADDPAAFFEMISQIVTLFATNGVVTDTIVTNPGVLQASDD